MVIRRLQASQLDLVEFERTFHLLSKRLHSQPMKPLGSEVKQPTNVFKDICNLFAALQPEFFFFPLLFS